MLLLMLLGCPRPTATTAPPPSAQGCVDGAVPPDRVQASVRRGVQWLADFYADEANRDALGLDGVVVFHELAATSADPWVREIAAPLAQQGWRAMSARQPGTPLEAVEALQLATIGAELGEDAGPLLDRALAILDDLDGAAEVCELPADDIDDLSADDQYGLLICAYDLARARARWPERVPDAAPLGPIHRDLLAEWRVHRPGVPPHERAFLATHHALVLNDYGRLALAEDDAPELFGWLRETFDRVLSTRDVELVAEYIDAFQGLGRSPEDDPMLRDGMCLLLATQRPDGSWGGPIPATDPYTTMHPTWTAVVGLRARTFLRGTLYDRYLDEALAP